MVIIFITFCLFWDNLIRRKLGSDYLVGTLANVIKDVTSDPDIDLEIDPIKVYPSFQF